METQLSCTVIQAGQQHDADMMTCSAAQVRSSERTPLLTCLLEGPTGTGKTALAATVGIESEFPYVKLVSAETMVGFSEQSKASQIAKVFEDAYKASSI